MPKTDNRNGNRDQEGNPVSNPELRGYYRIAAFFIFGELAILWGCSYIPSPDNYWLAVVTGTVSYMILLAMIVQTEVSELQWRAMREQAEIASRQLEWSDRPWLDFDVKLTSGLTFTKVAGYLDLDVVVRNIGRSVAANAIVHVPKLIATGYTTNGGVEVESPFLEAATKISPTKQPSKDGSAVFPNKPYTMGCKLSLNKAKLDRVAEYGGFRLWLVVRISYQVSGHVTRHYTQSVYELYRFRTTAEQSQVPLAFNLWEDVPLQRMVWESLIRYSYAD